MKYTNIILILALVMLGIMSCNRDEVFEKEQYKNVLSLVSGEENVFTKFYDLEQDESTGYISASVGGTNATTKEITLNLEKDPSLMEKYNIAQFDVDVSRYNPQLPSDKYDIESLRMVIPAGEIKGVIPVRVRPAGLSPDSIYFIPLRIVSQDHYEVNPEKNYVLYGVRLKNRWALGDGSTNYTMRGKLKIGASEIEAPGTKKVFPLSKNQVRVMAGNETYASSVVTFRKGAVILTVENDRSVTVRPYANLNIEQINGDPEYPNRFFIEDDGFKTYKVFLLYYRYTFDGTVKEMKEELRVEFNREQDEYDWEGY
jgi:hypothetical protein